MNYSPGEIKGQTFAICIIHIHIYNKQTNIYFNENKYKSNIYLMYMYLMYQTYTWCTVLYVQYCMYNILYNLNDNESALPQKPWWPCPVDMARAWIKLNNLFSFLFYISFYFFSLDPFMCFTFVSSIVVTHLNTDGVAAQLWQPAGAEGGGGQLLGKLFA